MKVKDDPSESLYKPLLDQSLGNHFVEVEEPFSSERIIIEEEETSSNEGILSMIRRKLRDPTSYERIPKEKVTTKDPKEKVSPKDPKEQVSLKDRNAKVSLGDWLVIIYNPSNIQSFLTDNLNPPKSFENGSTKKKERARINMPMSSEKTLTS
ncbi:hypothetical protein PTTG_12321 [Puccinia triticina 1-1 BBBD Race 1]|uniref:Uncharacterized protein n=1 Tax=Puccinia triticina (isolate 1-1 / race 1 (BBBD)) TaxID=630390 RepID=A0A180GF98_PUCT1|nr:hypothetical protein PTTG_12321 [Puccinia triticina 1-1 BBBD Race 1]